MKERIACCLIVRDDESTLRECLESLRPHVDELVIVDTGSVDKSPQIARDYCDKWELYLGANNPESGLIEDFAAARNKSWQLAESSVALWIDGDDILLGGEHLRRVVEAASADASYLWMGRYQYSPDTEQDRERMFFPRHKFGWQTPVHEVCLVQPPIEGEYRIVAPDESGLDPKRIQWIHRQNQSTKNREQGRNLRILKKYLSEVGEGDPRAMYYCGQEYACQGDMGNSLRLLRRFLEIGGWDEERCLALITIANQYQHIGDHRSALEWATKAMHEKAWPEPYFAIGRSYYALAQAGDDREKNLRRAAHFMQYGLTVTVDSPVLLARNPQARREIHNYLNVCLSTLGDLDGAIRSCEDGLALDPSNEDLRNNLTVYKAHRSKAAVLREVASLRSSGAIDQNQAQVIEMALHAQVTSSSAEPTSATLDLADLPPPAEGKLSLVFYVGHGLEPWSPDTIAKEGQGGSEIMAYEMAKRLAKLGHQVRLYGHLTPQMEGDYEGVRYLDASRYRNVECDVLIASRRPDAVDDVHGCRAKARVLWVHDVHCGEALTMQRSLRFDRILVLSGWHKRFFCDCYPTLPRDKVVVTRNGIAPEMFAGGVRADQWHATRAIYCSSPDRGLLTALECWPEVRKAVPSAELHVFYGFANYEKVARLTGDSSALRDISHLRHLLKTTEGVVERGRVAPVDLVREMLAAGVWAYPTWFSETSCISAMQAQAAGLRLVTTPIAALNETCGPATVFVRGMFGEPHEWWRHADYKAAWVKAVVEAMSNREGADIKTATEARARFSLDSLATEWERDLAALVERVVSEVVPRFGGDCSPERKTQVTVAA